MNPSFKSPHPSFLSFACAHRPAQTSHQSVCSWWICMVQLTLWRWCLLTPSGPGSTHLCECKNRINLEDFRSYLSEMITHVQVPLFLTASYFFLRSFAPLSNHLVSFSASSLQRQLHLHGDLDQQHPPRSSLAESCPEPIIALRMRGHHRGMLRGEWSSVVPH